MKFLFKIPCYLFAGLLVGCLAIALVIVSPFNVATFGVDEAQKLKYFPLFKQKR
ncbi:hypothetical protein [Spirosoma endophyticum]|uniref:Uncharacterized protein n=1 Tax=Spirosoma endophyticum TaxID=662367 RepID=A0A1I1SM67_9BACT|nr:hypothetical protein [Spirosoma endophyticum]SFD47574.1 hypothetical protein SAMN05216167_105159 [Spirosoma endophyticum]